ncbi:hypothetical protein IAE39_000557 [Pseudomonas sp. S37]|nr:hypothetical protein [Pseudomonas sp. S37]MBK4992383.1 hypothetical protein [Pseudomonas sp. S37]
MSVFELSSEGSGDLDVQDWAYTLNDITIGLHMASIRGQQCERG